MRSLCAKSGIGAIPVEEDQDLKVYFIDDFFPERFRFEDEVGEDAVVCKDFIFDPQRKKAMVHLVVAERELTQHLWVIVVHCAPRLVRGQGRGADDSAHPGGGGGDSAHGRGGAPQRVGGPGVTVFSER